MLECPSCQQALPFAARFCSRCGVRLSSTTTMHLALVPEESHERPVQAGTSTGKALSQREPASFFQIAGSPENRSRPQQEIPVVSEQVQVAVDPYAYRKRELAVQSKTITASMESLLPFVYENHREENRKLFADAHSSNLPLEDTIWGHVAFVIGAYGNYMHRYALNIEQNQQVWQALLWAVFYERCYRRKYLSQRCQQLFHFLLGNLQDTAFIASAIHDLEALFPHLEGSSLRKLEATLQQLPTPPTELLQRVNAQVQQARELQEVQISASSVVPGKERIANVQPHLLAADQFHQRVPDQHQSGTRSLIKRNAEEPGFPEEAWKLPREAAELQFAPSTDELLSFFTATQRQEFFAHIRAAHLEKVNMLLQRVRQPLFSALVSEFDPPHLRDYQAPRRPIRLGKKHADRFVDAWYLLGSRDTNEQLAGLHLFEQGVHKTTHPAYAPLAREWMFFARAIVQGSFRVVNDWEESFKNGESSWELIWNLAFFYQQTGYPAEALRVLRAGVDEFRAPISHLRFALACALYLLLEPGRYSEPIRANASTFLLDHLDHWPHPLSCLTWLVLAHERYGSLHPRQQSQRLSTFQELLEHPLSLPDPRKDWPEARINALEEVLVEHAHCEMAWFFWLNDYAEWHQRLFQAWVRLAIFCERLGRLGRAEEALQHLVEVQYRHDYARYQEGTPPPRAEYLRRNLERLFEFYQRHGLTQQSMEAFNSCYPSLSHLWERYELANRRLITLTRHHLESYQHAEEASMLAAHGENARDLSRAVTGALEHFKSDQRVGIFIDYENIASFIPRDMDVEAIGQALFGYAAQFGEVVCQWASASPQNLTNLADVRMGLEAAHFKVRFPRRELQFGSSKKNLADFALLECLSDASTNAHPDIYLIVSGDRDYYERICSLLDAGHIVRIIASADSQHLSLQYRELEQQRARERQAAGYIESDFFIDSLEEILCSLVSLN
jgi:hypothetical protein